MMLMNFNIDRNLAILLALLAVGLLIAGYFIFQQGPQNQTQNGSIITGNHTNNQTNIGQNQTQNGSIITGNHTNNQTNIGQNQTQNGSVNTSIANPASAYCVQNGGASRIVTAADGSQGGICVFPNGSQCEEWAYYRGECSPANYNSRHKRGVYSPYAGT